ncbi:hypothetical protein [[Muricauda] lutisoli]|uniref:SoxR reducing system RseC family protein n=1 Tax=[Muricauda] lutisoli TaxID=2816035 RepID=A0ABS3EW38_9FLAO|nr:hypothetical protein [[Muricauda] lutisoli]MBO0330399.1 hypothetical protein [[Muricauda] lutisoli]
MITLKRKKDLIDLLIPYRYCVNGREGQIKAGETVPLEFEDDYVFFQLKYLYFKSPKILLKKDVKTEITVGTAISNSFILTVIPFLILIFILISFTKQDIGIWNDVAKIIGIAYFGVLCYFPTFGYKKYLSIDIAFEE